MMAQPQFELIDTHRATVAHCFIPIMEDYDGRDASNLAALSEKRFVLRFHFREQRLPCEPSCASTKVRCHCLRQATPSCPEINDDRYAVAEDKFVEVSFSQCNR